MKSNKIRKKINTKIKNKIKSENFSSNSNLKTSINSSKNKSHNSKSISFKFENKTEETKKQLNNQKINNIINLPLKKIQPTKFIQNEPSTSSRTENNEKFSEFKNKKSNLNKSFSTKKNKEELIINSSNNIISELRAYSNFRDKFNDLLEQESEKSPTKTLLHSKTEKKQLKNSVLKINNKSRNNNETLSQSKTERIDTTVSLNQNENENLIEKKEKNENIFSSLTLTPMPQQNKKKSKLTNLHYEKMLRNSKKLRIYEYNMNLHKANMLKYEKFVVIIQRGIKKFLNIQREKKEKKVFILQKEIRNFLKKIRIRNKKIILIQSFYRMHLKIKTIKKLKNIIEKFDLKLIFLGLKKNYNFFIKRLKKTLSKKIKLTKFFNKLKKKIYNKRNFRLINKKIKKFIKLKESMKKLINKIKKKNIKINSKFFLKNFKIFSKLKFRNKNIETEIPFEQPIKIINIYKHNYLPISETFDKIFKIPNSNKFSKCCIKMFPRPPCELLTHSNILIKRIKKKYEFENFLETFKINCVDRFLLNKKGFFNKKRKNCNNNNNNLIIDEFKYKKISRNKIKNNYFNLTQLKNINNNLTIKKNFNTHVKLLRKKVILKKGSISKIFYNKNSLKIIKFLQKKIKIFLHNQKQKRIIKKNKEIKLRLFLILLQKNYVNKQQKIIFDILYKDYLGSFYTSKSLIINSEISENDYEKIYEMENNFLHKEINFHPEDGKINKVRIKLTKNINEIFNNKFKIIEFNNEKEIFQQKLFKK